jgi:protein-S-isoprenylcysteine O-methyltransferase Ste14
MLFAGTEMTVATPRVIGRAVLGLLNLVVVLGLAVFGPAGTLRFPEAWALLAVFAGSSLAITLYLARKDPALLARRTQAGPVSEKERTQKVIQAFASIAFLATLVVPAVDRRLGWTRAPAVVAVLGDLLVGLGFWVVFRVFRENTFTSAVIEVAAEQRVIETGPYAVVRHPMYSGALVLIAGIPLALGSFVGLVTLLPFTAVIVWRLLDEERFLVGHLAGYAEYCRKTRHRLLPGVW